MTGKRLYLLIFFFLIVLYQKSHLQTSIDTIIPSERRIEWNPGLEVTIPVYPVQTNVKDFGASGNGVSDDTQAFKNAISATAEGNALFIPEGTYLITSTLKIKKGIVLRGEGFSKTKINFNFNDGANCISIESWDESGWTNIIDGYLKGSNTIEVENNSNLKIGGIVQILQDNDPDVYTEGRNGSWDDESVGQILKVSGISGNTITLNKALYYSYNPDMKPRIRAIDMVEYAGIENMYIERVNNNDWGSNIILTNAAYCWIKNVWSEKTLTSHVMLRRTYKSEIRENFFHDSHVFGSGGQGYGITIEAQSTDNLIENNIFERLRHSMALQMGATGNVFGYNYSKDPFFEEGNDWLMSDVAVHGQYSYQNLFEGNTIQYILVDNVWGTNGPTTFFRNRIEKDVSHYLDDSEEFAFIKIEENNPFQNIIGNELGIASTSSQEAIIIKSTNEIIHGNYNYNEGLVSWDPGINERVFPNSLYLKQRPTWFGSLPWPFLGGDVSPNTNLLPAQDRFNKGKFIPEDQKSIINAPENLNLH
ncbi:MAG: dockerin [Calditrichae bacterium]|nr:dockerin [Calditrichia bacterium]